MFPHESSCYPKPVLHFCRPVSFQNPNTSFKASYWRGCCIPTLLSFTIAQLTGTTYSNLTFSDWTVWLACCSLSCTDCLILHCHKDWKGEVSVITLGGSFCVRFHKAACRHNSDDSLCVWHIYWCCLSNWPRSALLKFSSLWIVGFPNTYIKPPANEPQSHPINLWFFWCTWRQNSILMPNWS